MASDKENIRTTIVHNGQEKEGHIVLENSNPMSPYLQFNIQDDQVSTLLKNLSESCKKMIAMGFLSPSNLEQSMNHMNLELQRSNQRFNTYISNHPSRIEIVKNNESNVLVGAGIYSKNARSEKIIFRYQKHKLTECQLIVKLNQTEHIINLQFYNND